MSKWDQYLLEQETPSNQIIPPKKEENIYQRAKRGAATTGLEVVSRLAGAPGDIFSAINELVARPVVGAITGKPTTPYAETLPGKLLGTSAGIKKELQEKLPELKPQSETGALIDEVIGDIASLGVAKVPLAKNFIVSTASNIGKKLAKDFGFGEKGQAGTKTGLSLGLMMMNPRGANKYASQLYSEAKNILPSNATTDGTGLVKNLVTLRRSSNLSKGGQTTAKKEVNKWINTVNSKVHNGQVSVEELQALKQDLNAETKKLFSLEETKQERGTINLLKQVSKDVDLALEGYGKQNPAWLKKYREANEAFGVTEKSKGISKFLLKHANTPYGVGTILAGGLFNPAAIPYEAAALGTLKAGELGYRIVKSPVLAKHYAKSLEYAAKKNAVAMNAELSKIEEIVKPKKQKNKWSEYELD